jgi:hypothetical protein
MKFLKNIATTTVVTAAVLGAATLVQTQSAQAAILAGSRIDFTGRAAVGMSGIDFDEFLAGNAGLDQKILANSAAGSFNSLNLASFVNRFGTIKDLIPLGPKSNWAVFDLGTLLDPTDDIAFNLATIVADPSGLAFNVTGFFKDGINLVAGTGQLTIQNTPGLGVTTFSGFLKTNDVPTPALIPGIAAMGMGLLRKRKKAQEAAA